MNYDNWKQETPDQFKYDSTEPILYKCDCCYDKVEDTNYVPITIKDGIIDRNYCDYCLNELLKNTLKRI